MPRFRALYPFSAVLLFLLVGLACSNSAPQALNADQQTAVALTVAAAFPTLAPSLPPPSPTSSPSETPPSTLTLPPPTPTFPPPTAIPPTHLPPTPTPLPLGPPERITFSPGATAATVTGFVAANSATRYILRALQGQHTVLQVFSSSPDTYLTFYGANDTPPAVPVSQPGTRFEGSLWATQDYIISIHSGGQPATFTLQIQIDPLPAASACPACRHSWSLARWLVFAQDLASGPVSLDTQ